MLTSLAYVLLLGMALGALARRLRLPSLVGMLLAGILLGPCVLNLLSPSLLGISADLRQLALVIILTRAGLSLELEDLRRAGRPAVLLCFVPASFEVLGMVLLAPRLLGVDVLDAAIMGAVVGAVSPAVIVPRMLRLMEEGYGADKGIPQMILAGASVDDVFVIVLFTSFTGMAQGGSFSLAALAGVPVSIVLGGAAGLGWDTSWLNASPASTCGTRPRWWCCWRWLSCWLPWRTRRRGWSPSPGCWLFWGRAWACAVGGGRRRSGSLPSSVSCGWRPR